MSSGWSIGGRREWMVCNTSLTGVVEETGSESVRGRPRPAKEVSSTVMVRSLSRDVTGSLICGCVHTAGTEIVAAAMLSVCGTGVSSETSCDLDVRSELFVSPDAEKPSAQIAGSLAGTSGDARHNYFPTPSAHSHLELLQRCKRCLTRITQQYSTSTPPRCR